MSDFDGQLRAALERGAGDAPGTAGLADGARRRLRVRRRRTAVLGAAAAVVAVVVPTAVIASGGDGQPPQPVGPTPGPEWYQEIEVTCVEGWSWPVSAMAGGYDGEVDEGETRAAFANLLQEAPMDAPAAIREHGFQDVPYVVLAGNDEEAVVGVGEWSADGPGADGDYVRLERRDADLRPAGWGDCHQLSVALPEGRSQVEVSAPKGGVDPAATEVTVLVNEMQCSSARDPRPHLDEPAVVEQDDRVLVTMSSEAIVGGADCMGRAPVPVPLRLDEPLGDRELYDAGTWPPTPIEVAAPAQEPADRWSAQDLGWMSFELPPGWSELECSEGWVEYGPPGGCDGEVGIWVAESDATIDMCCMPGVRVGEDGTWSGYVHVGDGLIDIGGVERETALRVLGSARLPGEEAVPVAHWREYEVAGLVHEGPPGASDLWKVTAASNRMLSSRFPLRRAGAQRVDDRWQLTGDLGGRRVLVLAPSEGLAELIASTIVSAG